MHLIMKRPPHSHLNAKLLLRLHCAGLLFMLAGCNTSPTIVEVRDAWMRPHQLGSEYTTAVYLTIDNQTTQDVTLIGASLSEASEIEIHQTTQEEGVMRMRKVEDVTIPAGTLLQFKPGGHHLMVKGLAKQLQEGDSVRLTLTFDDHVAISSTVLVRWD